MRRTAMILTLMLIYGIAPGQAQVMEPGDNAGAPPLISNETPDERRVYELEQEARQPLPSADVENEEQEEVSDIPNVPDTPAVPVLGGDQGFVEARPTPGDARPAQTICPVSKEKLGSMGEPVEYVHNGQVYKLCCPMCLEEFAQNPEKYIAEMEALEKEAAVDARSADEQAEDAANEDEAEPKVIEFDGDDPVQESEMEGGQ